ncbi:MAG: PilC/PilY family type IV pilus protein [Pseudomonas sp.]|nr:PilC/PilY family type IV pilus protein [Pseudomonas sp.]
MKTLNTTYKTLLSALGFTIYFSGMLSATAATLDVSQKPLILVESVAPNLTFSIDDSGSMKRAHVPDSIAADTIMRTKRAKSANFNPIYYNPNITYVVPMGTNVNGSDLVYSTNFTSARHMGFKPAFGTVNLSNSYRATWYCTRDLVGNCSYGVNGFGSVKELAENPAEDFQVTATVTSSSPNATLTTQGGVTYNISRTGSGCTATASWGGISFSSVPCSRSSNTATVDLRTLSVPAYYYVLDPGLSGCTGSSARGNDDCYRLRLVTSSGQQNFAIWYSFYRDRALATQSAAHLAFYDMSSAVRLTWQSLNNCTTFNNSSGCGDNRFRVFSDRHKSNFLTWLTDVSFSGGTPLRETLDRAGKFLQSNTAWSLNPNPYTTTGTTSSTVQNPMHACRPSFHIMMTDGMWNGANGTPTNALRPDHVDFTLPDGTSYVKTRRPYADATTSTLADLAMHYWATDLSNLNNDIKPYVREKNSNATAEYWDPRNNPANWQHMTNYMVGLGLSEALNNANVPWEGSTFNGGYLNILNGNANWPAASDSNANNVYDLWHAAINSRGEFFSVESPDDMVKAFKDILNRIADRTSSAARPAVSASFVSDATDNSIQSNVYATQFSSEDWSGELTKTLISSNGVQTLQWSAKSENQNIVASTRKVMIKDTSNATSKLKNFTWSNLDTLQQGWLNLDPASLNNGTDNKGTGRVAYIRGDRSQEGTESTTFRKRSTIIGDIVNSSPVVVGTPAYLAYLADRIENPSGANLNYKSYADFRTANQKTIRKEMIYVGGNDGMLHGFNAKTGKEEFAFIPTEVIKNLYRLTGQNYQGGAHHFYVDGSPIVRDVYFGDAENEGWRTILIGTLRAGGKALFALDITDPENIKLLWEFDSSNDSDLGYTFAQPEITRLHTGEWAVLMGNGYNSTNDRAALMIFDIKTGNLLKKLVVPDVVDAGVTLSNGLSSVRGADNNGDGVVDYAYAGDLQGNLWRFDLIKTDSAASTTSDPFARSTVTTINSDLKIAYGGKPLFTARDADAITAKRQAITIQPSLVRHPSGYGYLVLFGTGKYFENSDANVDNSRAMTLYGVWDRQTKRQTTTTGTARATDRTKLGAQQFTSQVNNAVIGDEDQSAVNDIRLLSQNQIEWYNAGTTNFTADTSVKHWGWKLNLAVNNNLTGEMIVNNMAARGQTLFVTSLTPNQDPCKAGADTWLYGVSAYTGGRTKFNVLDLNNDQIVNSKDTYGSANDVVSGVRFPAIGGFTLAPGNKIYGSDGANDPGTVGDDPNTTGRQSWHIVPEEFQ